MNKIKNFFSDWSWKEELWLAFVLIFQTVAWAINNETVFMLIMTLTSSLNLVLGAKGKIAGLYFAIINSAMYAYSCLSIPLYGEIMYNVLYSIPVSISAIILWKKNTANGGEIKFRTMSKKFLINTILITIVAVFGYAQILKWMGGNFALMDSLTTVVSVIASMLYMLRYSEQWLMWVIVNALSIVMWIMVFLSGDHSALLIIIMKVVNLCNSSYGYFNWKRIAERVNQN
ncbi:nicotinamide mononucleotide transporter PnuC [Lachnospiraceae bacterium AM23-2LB]|nr:nicotinamide mononucleotide transporter PnuC [Lachnospiraceae bacterium AM23-2LB]RJW05236.1 nicotinamide mononucleotide transporter PnuC [Lachnospiraceae bacterium AM40-2BH]